MTISKAQLRATAKYMKNNYDEIKIRIPKGEKAIIQAHVEKTTDKSVNEFIQRAIKTTIESDLENA